MKREILATALAAILSGTAAAQSEDPDEKPQSPSGTQAESQSMSEDETQGQDAQGSGQTQGQSQSQTQDQSESQSTEGQTQSSDQGEQSGSTAGSSQGSDQGGQAGAAGSGTISQLSGNQIVAADLLGASVTNNQDEEIGEINDLILDQEGKVAGVVVGVGGFLGMGEKAVGLSWDRVQYDSNTQTASVDVSREELESAPELQTEQQAQQ